MPFLEQARALASCFNNVVIPWSDNKVPDATAPAAAEVYQETAYGLAGVAGESRSGDANGQYFRVLGGGGTNTIAPSRPRLAERARRVTLSASWRPAGASVIGEDAVPPRRPVRDPGAARLNSESGRPRPPTPSGKARPARSARRSAAPEPPGI